MKRFALIPFIILSCPVANAQMARWVIHPNHDKIYMAEGESVILSDSASTCTLWDINGKRLATTADTVQAFREGLAVTTERKTGNVTGFYTTGGAFTAVSGYAQAYAYPYFSDGFLLVQAGDQYRMLDVKGKETEFGYFEKIYPFNRGYAACMAYDSPENKKNPYFYYATKERQPVTLSLNGKPVDNKDVEFLSSLSDDSVGVAVIKHKVYYYEAAKQNLKPVLPNESEPKKQARVNGDLDEWLSEENDTIYLKAKGIKDEIVTFVFDRLCRPLTVRFAKRDVPFAKAKHNGMEYPSNFKADKAADGMFGLTYKGATTLPPQFEDVGLCINDFAVVRSKGKWGLLTMNDALKFRLQMNKGNDIAFRHQKFETMIRIDLPTAISADHCRFDIAPQYGCDIDKTSIETRNTESGNFVQYSCTLTIPDSLPDKMTKVEYPVQITYEGIKYPVYPLAVRAWHYKYINVDLNDSEIVVSKGNVAFTINISAEKNPGDGDYPFEVKIKTNSLRTELEKLSETRYKCKLYSLAEGVNVVSINIQEQGCLPTVFPLEIIYKKPVANSEQVEIKKKDETPAAEAAGNTGTEPVAAEPMVEKKDEGTEGAAGGEAAGEAPATPQQPAAE